MKKKVTKTETTFDVDGTESPEMLAGTLPLESADGLENYLNQFGQKPIKVKVYKRGLKGMAYCFSGGTEIDEDTLSQYGGGEYELIVLVDGVKEKSIPLFIADRPNGQTIATPTVATEPQSGSVEVRMLREQLIFLQNMVINKQSAPATPLGELVDAMKLLGNGGGKDPTELFLKGLEFAKEHGSSGSGDWKSMLVDSIRDVAKTVAPVLAAKTNGGNQTMIQQNPDDMIKSGLAYLKQRAISGMPVDVVVNWVMFSANDPTYQPFLKLVLSQEFEEFVKLDAEIAQEPYLTWFRTLHAGLREAFNESQLDDDSERPAGNVRNITGNAKVGDKRK